jgi:cell division protease FtsH
MPAPTPTPPATEATPPAPSESRWRRLVRSPFAQAGAAVGVIGLIVALALLLPASPPPEFTLSELRQQLAAGEVTTLRIDDSLRTATADLADGSTVRAAYPLDFGPTLVADAEGAGVPVEVAPVRRPGIAEQLLLRLLPTLLLLGVIVLLLRQRMGVGAFVGNRGKAAAVPATRFVDVAGAAEATGELAEVVGYLQDPTRYTRLGARPPRGMLLVGPPGTGKTLLARAVAGEAGVPFFAISGSDFVETFVGVGASRVRSLFDRARKSPEGAIVFIDEIDAVGKRRGGASNGSSDEREHTLNQLLVEMDGFAEHAVVVLAATNRPDVLDPALTRPGRFDRQITVAHPDRAGREEILALYLADKPVSDDLDLTHIARRTPRFTGADLANLVNQAALAAAREQAEHIGARHLDDAVATVVLGRERRSAEVLERDRRITAWHEAGHTVAALCQPAADPPAGVSIVPRGHAGGATWMTGNDHVYLSAPAAQAQLVVAMAGRAAEQLVFGGEYTQGAAGDLRHATDLATRMAADYGMSPIVGPVHIPEDQRQLGASADLLQQAVRELLAGALSEAEVLVRSQRALLDAIAVALLDEETLDADALETIRTRCAEEPAA